MTEPPISCHITGNYTSNVPSSVDACEYSINFNKKEYVFRFHWGHKNNSFVDKNKYILRGLILNNIFPSKYIGIKGKFLTNEILEKIIRESIYPRSPEEKMSNLLKFLHSSQSFEGSTINYIKGLEKLEISHKLYFNNYSELTFYLYTLRNKNYIDANEYSGLNGFELGDIKLTYEGLTKIIEINESGTHSNKCFIAMSFSESQSEKRTYLKEAIIESGYIPIIIDEIHVESDTTINDAIISEIKKSKFVIADFTEHKHGVYFEAGFALGLKKPLIYLCEEYDFKNTHFDTNHYPHIIYKDFDELKMKLKLKIEAWIS